MDMGINRPTKTRSNQPKKRTGFRGHLDDMSTFLFLGVTPLCQKVWNHEAVSDFIDDVKGSNPENLLLGATEEQVLTLCRLLAEGVNEDICVQEDVGVIRQILEASAWQG